MPAVLLLLSPLIAQKAEAQFLRLGPFDFSANSKLELIYSTNVENQRPSEADEEMEDYYLTVSLDLRSQADVAPSTKLNIDTGITVERHFVRTDLDNTENPFGRVRIASLTEIGYYKLSAFGRYESDYEEDEQTYVPAGLGGQDLKYEYEYGVGLQWKRGPITLAGDYAYLMERHDAPVFQDDDRDETTLNFLAAWRFAQNMSVRYELEKKKTVLVNKPNEDEGYDNTQTIALDARLKLIKRPEVTYSLGIEKEDTDEKDGEWEPIHSLNARDKWDISPTLHLSLSARYEYEQSKEADDITFVYGGFLDHDISASAKQSFHAEREPVSTFGSTTKSDQTTYGYRFTKYDIFIYNLNFGFDASYEINRPLGVGETEKVLEYGVNLTYQRALSRKLTRALRYEYTAEDSNLKEELLEEHRVTLSYVYTF